MNLTAAVSEILSLSCFSFFLFALFVLFALFASLPCANRRRTNRRRTTRKLKTSLPRRARTSRTKTRIRRPRTRTKTRTRTNSRSLSTCALLFFCLLGPLLGHVLAHLPSCYFDRRKGGPTLHSCHSCHQFRRSVCAFVRCEIQIPREKQWD